MLAVQVEEERRDRFECAGVGESAGVYRTQGGNSAYQLDDTPARFGMIAADDDVSSQRHVDSAQLLGALVFERAHDPAFRKESLDVLRRGSGCDRYDVKQAVFKLKGIDDVQHDLAREPAPQIWCKSGDARVREGQGNEVATASRSRVFHSRNVSRAADGAQLLDQSLRSGPSPLIDSRADDDVQTGKSETEGQALALRTRPAEDCNAWHYRLLRSSFGRVLATGRSSRLTPRRPLPIRFFADRMAQMGLVMTLITAHKILIGSAIALFVFYGCLELTDYSATGGGGTLLRGCSSLLAAVGFAVYLRTVKAR